MIKIAILGDIGAGKSFIAKQFGYPVFNADDEVKKIYSQDKRCYKKLKKAIPQYISSFPINKTEVTKSYGGKLNPIESVFPHESVAITQHVFTKILLID